MTTTRIASWICILFCCLVPTRSGGTQETEGPSHPGSKTEKVARAGPELAVSLPRQGTAGEACWAAVTLRSLRSERVHLAVSSYHRTFEIALRPEKGASIPFTRFGAKKLPVEVEGGKIIVIRAGSRVERRVNLARLFDRSPAGTCLFSVQAQAADKDLKTGTTLHVDGAKLVAREPQ